MKYVLLTFVAIIVFLLAGALLTLLIRRFSGRPKSLPASVALSLCLSILSVALAIGLYLADYYHADETAYLALDRDESVAVETTEGGLRFDGPGTETALIFLPGAKVEPRAYAPLLDELAQRGIDCYLVEPLGNLAFFATGDVDTLLRTNTYAHWIIAGHSLGGTVSASYAAAHSGEIDALALLAAYTTKPIAPGVSVCSIYGSEDGVLNLTAYEEQWNLLPQNATELRIEGGNHANFGNYGPQKGDSPAIISQKEQQRQTVKAIVELAQSLDL